MHDGEARVTDLVVESAAMLDPGWWDKLVLGSPGATIFQSSAWARYVGRERSVRFLWATAAGRPCGALLLEASTPARSWRRMLGVSDGAFAWRHGPLVLEGDPGEVGGRLLDEVERQAREERVRGVQSASAPLCPEPRQLSTAFAMRGYEAAAAATVLVDVSVPREQLWEALDPAARKAVRRCEKTDVTVRRLGADESLDEYHALLRETRARLQLDMPPYYPTTEMRAIFRQSGGLVEVFVATHRGLAVGALGVIGFGPTIVEVGLAQSDHAVRERIYAGDILKWSIIRWAHEAGLHWYDLGGIDPNPTSPKAAGIRRFKEKWGGRIVEHDTYHYYGARWRGRWWAR